MGHRRLCKDFGWVLVRFYLQNLRLMVFFDENEDFANWDLIGVAALL